jgi:mono/diheme cytochrome c family protein
MKKYILGIALIGLSLKGFSQDTNKGKGVYTKTCIACHQATGTGIPGAFPPLAKSDYLNADVNRAIKQVIKGSNAPITVNGKKYTTAMPPQALSDQQIADVLTYVYANWGNSKKVVTIAMVKTQRK